MQQGECRLAGHAGIAVGGAGHHVFLQAQYGAHGVASAHLVDQLHLRGAGVGETGIQAGVCQGLEEGLCSIHGVLQLFIVAQ